MIEVPLSKGKVALVDDIDADRVMQFKWSTTWSGRRWYAYRTTGGRSHQQRTYLHRFILEATEDEWVDHVDGNGLDCRRHNIRIATPSQNAANCGPRARNRIGYRGVGWSTKEGKWIAQIQCNGKKERIGCFADPVAAAKAYDSRARDLFGEFAFQNFP